MTTLTPEAEALLRTVRRADGAKAADRARLRQRLAPTFAAGVGAGAAAAATLTARGAEAAVSLSASKLGVAQVMFWVAVGASAGAVVTGGVEAVVFATEPRAVVLGDGVPQESRSRGGPSPSVPATPLQQAPSFGATNPAPLGAMPEPPAPPQAMPKSVSPRQDSNTESPGSPSQLAAETRLLQAAQQRMRAGGETEALRILDEHAAAYPNALLAAEQRATRVLALCRLGRVEEAREQVRQLLRVAPDSPVLPSILRSCAFPDAE